MASFNRVILLGTLNACGKLCVSGSGLPVIRFVMTLTERHKIGKVEVEDRASNFDCVAYGRLANLIDAIIENGAPILVEGKLTRESDKVVVQVSRLQYVEKRRVADAT